MYVAIMGYGVVGSGVAELIYKNRKQIAEKCRQDSVEVKYILDLRTFPGDPFEKLVTSDFNKILEDKEVTVVVETMGGLKPAYEYVLACLENGKSVVTSNKELVAAKGLELLKTAEKNNVNFMFEASVGGGIPIIRPLIQCLAANEINEVAGILNGTTNFILTKMFSEGSSFEDALALAQKLGYAERNPSADVDGLDACRKICILASLCYGKHVYPDNIHTEGISKISANDVEYAQAWGGVIKLIGSAKVINDRNKISVSVSPSFVKNGSQLANTNDVFNAILVRGDAVGDVVFYGRGAGKLPTASAVVADVMDCINNISDRKYFGWSDYEKDFVDEYSNMYSEFFVRVNSNDTDKIKNIFGDVTFITFDGAPDNESAFVTESISVAELDKKLDTGNFEAVSVFRITDY